MRIFATIILAAFLTLTVKAECTFESFAVGEDYSIGNMLEWITSSEIDNQEFVIEKSENGLDYSEIGKVEGAGTSSEDKTYRFMDLDAQKGRTYYRIKQLDFDGEYSYSQTVIVNKETDNNFMIASINTSLESETIELTIDAFKELTITYAIKDLKGDLLQENETTLSADLNNLVFDLSSYPKGVYRLYIQSGEEVETISIRKTGSKEEEKAPVAKK